MKKPPIKSAASTKRRIYLVEDHPVTQQGFCLLIDQEPDLIVCGRATTAKEAMLEITTSSPDLVIVDIALQGGMDGLELIHSISSLDSGPPTLVLSTMDESIYAKRALRAGAMGYIMKLEPVEQLLAAVRQVLNGEVYMSPRMRTNLLLNSIQISAENQNATQDVNLLSNKELVVFRMIGEGLRTAQISEQLNLSRSTIETYRTHIKNKLGARNANDLMRHAVEWLHTQRSGRDL